MKITKSELIEIIKEELGRLNEMDDFPGFKEMKFTDLDDAGKKLGRKVSEVVKPGATPAMVLDAFGQKVFAFTNPVRLRPSQLQELSKLAQKVVIKDRYTYIQMPLDK